jgi:hypothetical protein
LILPGWFDGERLGVAPENLAENHRFVPCHLSGMEKRVAIPCYIEFSDCIKRYD